MHSFILGVLAVSALEVMTGSPAAFDRRRRRRRLRLPRVRRVRYIAPAANIQPIMAEESSPVTQAPAPQAPVMPAPTPTSGQGGFSFSDPTVSAPTSAAPRELPSAAPEFGEQGAEMLGFEIAPMEDLPFNEEYQ